MAAVLLLVAEFVLNTVIIHKVQYTEIDWVAYMQVGATRGLEYWNWSVVTPGCRLEGLDRRIFNRPGVAGAVL